MQKFDFEVLGMGMNNSGYPGAFTEPVKQIIKSTIKGSVLHLYSGSSLIGDERIDLEHPNATKNCRVEDFIKEDKREWDWCLLDPPYTIQRANLKLGAYGEYGSLSGNTLWRAAIRRYCQINVKNILWLDMCAPSIKGFRRKKLWLLLPGGFHTVRILSWLEKTMQPLL